MQAGLAALALGYVLSQFYRAFLAVLSPVLQADLGLEPSALSDASGMWFLSFALMQLPVGWALDRFGPRDTAAVLLALGGGGGAAVFAMATSAGGMQLAMALIGIGCSPVLMAAYYIFARAFRPALFATLAGGMIGLGSLGNIAGSLPLARAAEAFGWRGTMAALAVLTLVTALTIRALVRNPDAPTTAARGSVLDLLRIPALWPILPLMAVNYAPAAGLRGLWAGPYLSEVFAADGETIGRVTLVMGLAMVAGNFAYGPLERLLGNRKWLLFGGNALAAASVAGLWLWPAQSVLLSTVFLAGVGLFGASYGIVIAHGRAFFPAHLMGRGVTLMNLFGIGGTGLMQAASGRLFALAPNEAPAAPYLAVFAFFSLLLAIGTAIYAFSENRND
ncbi:MAG: MFS transporter [Paracoccaceae bacterium]